MPHQCCPCFEDYIVKCPDEIQVNAQLTPLTEYIWVITDKFDKQYSGTFTTDENGFWTIPVTDLPDGLLTEFSGNFKLEVLDDSCKPIKFLVASEYDCINFTVKAGTREKNNLGCDFLTTP
jgi:hypothetical protein